MIARLLISPDLSKIKEAINKTLILHLPGVSVNHPDILYFQAGEKLGIAEARKIKGHFAFKPYYAEGRVVIIEDAGILTPEAQNALLKTLEEPPKEAILILGASSDVNILPTILSRCEITNLEAKSYDTLEYHSKYTEDLEELLSASVEERFGYIENLKDKEEFLHAMSRFFRQTMLQKITKHDAAVQQNVFSIKEINQFLKELLQTEQWAKQNVNIRAILEYLMLVMPKV